MGHDSDCGTMGKDLHFGISPGFRRWKKPAPVEPWLGDLDCTSNRAERLGRPVQAVAPHEDRQPAEARPGFLGAGGCGRWLVLWNVYAFG